MTASLTACSLRRSGGSRTSSSCSSCARIIGLFNLWNAARTLLVSGIILTLAACGGGSSSDSGSSSNTAGPTVATYKLRGALTGLSSGKSVSLSYGTDHLQLNADGTFQMPTAVNDGTKYHIQVSSSDPTTQPCTSTSADGEVHSENVNYIQIYCGISPSGVVSATGALNDARYVHTATLLPGGKVLVTGGFDISGYTISSSELYDPATQTWSLSGSLNYARKGHTATLLPNGKVLVAGGFNNDSSGQPQGQLSTCELYDPATETWSVTGALTDGRDGHTATLLSNGKVLVTGGYDTSGKPLASSELYDPVLGTWSPTGALANARYFHTATLLPNGMVLVAGGTATYGSNLELASSELYDPVTEAWSTTGALATARHSYLATLLPNGKVLAAGGYDATGTAMADCELYDPATGIWSPTGAMSIPRFLGTATMLLPSGKVLASGGFGVSSNELYDPTTETWTATASLITAREYHTATFLPNGKVLITGGYGAPALSSSELYW